ARQLTPQSAKTGGNSRRPRAATPPHEHRWWRIAPALASSYFRAAPVRRVLHIGECAGRAQRRRRFGSPCPHLRQRPRASSDPSKAGSRFACPRTPNTPNTPKTHLVLSSPLRLNSSDYGFAHTTLRTRRPVPWDRMAFLEGGGLAGERSV